MLFAGGVTAQEEYLMKNADTIFINVCQKPTGVLVDDGGGGPYSNNFRGWAVIKAVPGITITLQGDYKTYGASTDYLTVWDGDQLIENYIGGEGSLVVNSTSGELTVRFQTNGSGVDDGFVLQWSIDGNAATCPVAVSQVDTVSVTATTATLSWTASGAGPFRLLVGDEEVATSNTTTATLVGLNPSSRYSVMVLPQSAGDNLCCGSIVSFRTRCGNVVMPFVEGFEGLEERAFPDCWLLQYNFDDEDYVPQIDAAHHSTGQRSLMLSCGNNATPDHFGMVATPPFEGTGLRRLRLTLRASHANTRVVVGTCDSTGSEYNYYGFTPLDTLTLDAQWQTTTVSWFPTAPSRRLALRMLQSMQPSTGCMIYIEEIAVEVCGVDSVSASHVDYDRFTLDWSTFGSPVCRVGLRVLGQHSDTLSFDNAVPPLVIEGLDAQRTYVATVYPQCAAQSSIGRGVVVTTTAPPMSAEGFCSGFLGMNDYLEDWTQIDYAGRSFGLNGNGVRLNGPSYVYSPTFLVSQRLLGLAGKRVVITYTSNSSYQLRVGTMSYADDTSTFSLVGTTTLAVDGYRHTFMCDIPVSDTGRYIAIEAVNHYFAGLVIHSIEVDLPNRVVGHQSLVHRRGTSVQLDWTDVLDTVLVEHVLDGYAPGTGTVDTFYNAHCGTVRGLSPSVDYDFYIYRPGASPCIDRRLAVRTATRDYTLPSCWDFSSDNVGTNPWSTVFGDWRDKRSVNNSPRFTSRWSSLYESGGTTQTLEFASWGMYGYSSMVGLPDVEVDSNSYLSFYMMGTHLSAEVHVGTIREGYSSGYFLPLDTVEVGAGDSRHHYVVPLRPSDTLFNGVLALWYNHPQEFIFYRGYIDEMQVGGATYGNVNLLYVGYDTCCLSLDALYGTDSADVTLERNGVEITRRVHTADMSRIEFGSLEEGSSYRVYVTPLGKACRSFAMNVHTKYDYNGGDVGVKYESCFHFSTLLTDELPTCWAASGAHAVEPPDDEMRVEAGSAIAMHPMYAFASGATLLLRARAEFYGDSLILGYIAPGDTIPIASSSFGLDTVPFVAFDTLVLDSVQGSFALTLPFGMPSGFRMAFRACGSDVLLDNISVTDCPVVQFNVDGNVIECTMPGTSFPDYNLSLLDTTGDYRVLHIDESPFRIEGLKFDMPYEISVSCGAISNAICRQQAVVRTHDRVPLPYCQFFNKNYTSIALPVGWTVIKSSTSQSVNPSTSGPSLVFSSYSSEGWLYAVLPQFDADSVLTMMANFFSNRTNQTIQIGVMDNETDTASFIPLWTSTDWEGAIDANVDISNYIGKRVAIRKNGISWISLYSVRVYGVPRVGYSLPHAGLLRAKANHRHPYWLSARKNSDITTFAVNDTLSDFHLDLGYHYLSVGSDSLGNTCETEDYRYLGDTLQVPFCLEFDRSNDAYYSYFSGRLTLGSVSYTNYYSTDDEHGYMGISPGSWCVLPELMVDSVRDVGMSIVYSASQADDSLVVGIMTDAYDTLSFVPLDTLTYSITNGKFQNSFVDFSNYADTGRWVAIHYLRGSDKFKINGIYTERCAGAAGAVVSLKRWNRVQVDAPAVPFYAEYFPSSTSTQGSPSNTVVRIDSVPAVITLEPETTYDFYFRCDSAAVSCRLPQVVTTLAAPLEVPSCIDFDSIVTGDLPRGWNAMTTGIMVTDSLAHSGGHSLLMPIGTQAYVVTPDANIDSIQRLAMSLWYRVGDVSDRLVVGVMSNPEDLTTYHPISTLAPAEADVWQHGLVEFSSTPGDPFFVVLRARSNHRSEGRSILVDDIYVDTSVAFDLRVKEITSNSITLDWRQRGTPDVKVTVSDEDGVIAEYNPAAPPLTIEPLSILHYYTFVFEAGNDSAGYCNTSYRDTLSIITPAPGVGCVNATDLNSSQAVFFTGRYDNPYMAAGAVDYGPRHSESRHTVCYDTAARDPRTDNLLRTIPEGYTSSVRLGNWSTNYFEPEAEGVIYSLYVDTGSFELLLLRYAAVLQDPIHAYSDQPRFRMELLDTNYNIIDSACTSADFIADQSLGWNSADDGVLWKDWTAVGIDLSGHAGEQVYLRLTTYDCNEGSHYGYAYFTLECMRKNMNTASCGDVDSNTLSAPEGFHYRWYTSQSPATVSTGRVITVPSEDITYYCEVSKLDNPACNFTISAYGGTRYPMADFDYVVSVSNCRFYVDFINRSSVSIDGRTPIPGQRCETAYWDFGNGTSSTAYHGHAVYYLPGDYTVRLVSGIGLDACRDTAYVTLHLSLPGEPAPTSTWNVSICDNQPGISFFGHVYYQPGTYYHNVPVEGQECDSLYVLQLDVRATTTGHVDRVVCDSLYWKGTLYAASGDYTAVGEGPNSVGCDSSTVLHLTVNHSAETTDSIVICPGRSFEYRGVDYGGPAEFDAHLITRQGCDSLVHVVLFERSHSYALAPSYRFDTLDWLPADTAMLLACAPAVLNMRDTTVGASSWLWTVAMRDTVMLFGASSFELPFSRGEDSVQAYVRLEVTDLLGCFDTVAWPVFVFGSPVADFWWEPDFPAVHHPVARFINLSRPDTLQWKWRFQMPAAADDTSSAFSPLHRWGDDGADIDGDYEASLVALWVHSLDTVRSEDVTWLPRQLEAQFKIDPFVHTCTDTARHTVTITNDFLQFPNLVTPNGDGVDDTWEVVNLVEFGNYSENELWIFDRTGALVFHARNIRRHDQFWDPEATRSPDGTYYYRFSGKGEYGVVKRNGVVEVLRD